MSALPKTAARGVSRRRSSRAPRRAPRDRPRRARRADVELGPVGATMPPSRALALNRTLPLPRAPCAGQTRLTTRVDAPFTLDDDDDCCTGMPIETGPPPSAASARSSRSIARAAAERVLDVGGGVGEHLAGRAQRRRASPRRASWRRRAVDELVDRALDLGRRLLGLARRPAEPARQRVERPFGCLVRSPSSPRAGRSRGAVAPPRTRASPEGRARAAAEPRAPAQTALVRRGQRPTPTPTRRPSRSRGSLSYDEPLPRSLQDPGSPGVCR